MRSLRALCGVAALSLGACTTDPPDGPAERDASGEPDASLAETFDTAVRLDSAAPLDGPDRDVSADDSDASDSFGVSDDSDVSDVSDAISSDTFSGDVSDAISSDTPPGADTCVALDTTAASDGDGAPPVDASDGGTITPGTPLGPAIEADYCGGFPTCAIGERRCGRTCVATKTEPAVGCGGPSCLACPTLPHALPACTAAGVCTFTCQPGWHDCNGLASDGCEQSLTMPANCGGCGVACPAGQLCTEAGTCVSSCPSGTTRCGGTCFDMSTSLLSCGACDTPCTSTATTTATCSGGTCTHACVTGYVSCGGTCVQLSTNPANCGACGRSCAGISDLCTAGTCAGCAEGRSACPGGCQELSYDAANCGACGHVCAAGQRCATGVCLNDVTSTIVTGLSSVIDLVHDADSLYWTEAGQVNKIAKGGGTILHLATGRPHPDHLAVAGGWVYWTDDVDGVVTRVPVGGGTAQELSYSTRPDWIVVDGTNVYFSDWSGATGGVYYLPTGGGTTTKITGSEGLGELALDDQYLFANLSSFAVGSGGIFRFTKPGGPSVTISGSAVAQQTLTIDCRNAYDTYGNFIKSIQGVDKLSGDITFGVGVSRGPSQNYSAGTALYSAIGNDVWRYTKQPFSSVKVVAWTAPVIRITVDDHWLYFADAGSIHAVPR
jgi:hypothetical protein